MNNEYTYKSNRFNATCEIIGKKCLVKKGSKISQEIKSSLSKNDIERIKKFIDNKIIIKWIFTEDYLFSSTSMASNIISGTNTNGNECWKNKNGIKLSKILKVPEIISEIKPHIEIQYSIGSKIRNKDKPWFISCRDCPGDSWSHTPDNVECPHCHSHNTWYNNIHDLPCMMY